jgi:membrane protease YdiL (CAAX protease family)
MTNTKNNTLTIIGGILLMIILMSFVPAFGKLFHIPDNHFAFGFFLSRIFIWIALGLVFLYAIKIERQPLLLWKDKKYTWKKNILFFFSIIGTLIVLLMLTHIILHYFGIKADSAKMALMMSVFKSNILLLVFTAFTAGVTEELLFRGYLLPRLIRLSKSPVFAIILSAVLFAMLHVGYGTWVQVIGPFWIGLVFAVFYWKYRNIKFLIIFHFLWDLIAILLQIFASK